MERKLEIGDVVTFVDTRYRAHVALITAIHGNPWGALSKTKVDAEGKYVADANGFLISEELPETKGKHWPCINLLYVSSEESEQDQYGRQIKREASVVHIASNTAGANCWQWPDEEHHVVVNRIS